MAGIWGFGKKNEWGKKNLQIRVSLLACQGNKHGGEEATSVCTGEQEVTSNESDHITAMLDPSKSPPFNLEQKRSPCSACEVSTVPPPSTCLTSAPVTLPFTCSFPASLLAAPSSF